MQPVAPTSPPKPKGAALLWIGGLTVVAGIVLGIVLLVVGIKDIAGTVDGYERVSASEGGTVQLDDTGTYKVFLERPGIDDDVISFSGYQLPSVQVVAPDGTVRSLSISRTSETYSYGGRDGRKLGTFRAEQEGAYRLTVTGGSTGRLAVGKGGPEDGLIQVGLGILGGGAVVVVGIILLIVGGVRRSRSKKVFVAPGGWAGYGQPIAPGWAPPPTGAGGWAPPPAPGWAPPAQPGGWGAPPPAGPPGWSPPPAAPAPAPPAAPAPPDPSAAQPPAWGAPPVDAPASAPSHDPWSSPTTDPWGSSTPLPSTPPPSDPSDPGSGGSTS